ncbi:hypothetical protein [Rhizobium sp. IMFF44]|uniref:hypothetical protein n=1 Tax=Rhizobium sp. IMFF44 TaxID=3342350 RepID=UPI0035B9D3C5
MAEILRQLAGAEIAGNEDLPPTYKLKFSEEEFPSFIANPVKVMAELGLPVERLNVSLSNSSWIKPKKKWVKNSEIVKADLPHSSTWHWLCGYEDEMCVCYQVQDM